MVTTSLYPISIGGPGNVTSHLARELDKCGLKLTIIFEVPQTEQVSIALLRSYMGIRDSTELVPLRLAPKRITRFTAMPSTFYMATRKMRDADLVHFQTYPDIFPYSTMLALTKAKHIPCALSYHGSTILKIKQPGHKRTLPEHLRLSYISLTKSLFDAIIVPSFSMAQRTELEGFEGKKIRVIPNGIDLDKFQGIESMKLDGEPSILWVGYPEWDKGVDIIVGAMKILLETIPSARLHFVGPYRPEFIDELKREELEDVIRIHGSIPPLMMPSYYAGADICVNPSRWESFSLVVIEAMAAGRPVVASRVGGIKEIIDDGVNGLLSNPDAYSFAKAILRAYNDADLRKRISQNAFRRAKEFNWPNITSHYLHLYEELYRAKGQQDLRYLGFLE